MVNLFIKKHKETIKFKYILMEFKNCSKRNNSTRHPNIHNIFFCPCWARSSVAKRMNSVFITHSIHQRKKTFRFRFFFYSFNTFHPFDLRQKKIKRRKTEGGHFYFALRVCCVPYLWPFSFAPIFFFMLFFVLFSCCCHLSRCVVTQFELRYYFFSLESWLSNYFYIFSSSAFLFECVFCDLIRVEGL